MLPRVQLSLSLILFALLTSTTTNADVPRPRGVPLERASLYYPRKDNTWVCLDGSKTINFARINDDFCDCNDGSDEPATAACPSGEFYCLNMGYRSQYIRSSLVNDGICDCCDGTDEYNSSVNCTNTCHELGRVEEEQRRILIELHQQGSVKRLEMITIGRKLKADREVRRLDLERQRNEQEIIKNEKESLKRNAEAAEAEALEFYKEQQREQEEGAAAAKIEEEQSFTTKIEAEASFVKYDVNKDGFVEVTELQVDMLLDRDRNGVVTVEEAKYFLDERDRINMDTFISLSWPRIKPLQMLAQGIFKPPEEETAKEGEPQIIEESTEIPNIREDQPQGSDIRETGDDKESEEIGDDGEGADEGYDGEEEDIDADVGVGSVSEETVPAPEYDPETQRLIELANEARNAYTEVERHLRDIEHELKDINEQNAKDYGPHEEYAVMNGQCFTFDDREYTYTLCPFDRASQKPRNGGSETTLGRWDQWLGEGNNKYGMQKYSHGASCWNGPQRSAIVQLKCALESSITAVSEPNRCEYFFEFETPAACNQEFDGHNGKSNSSHDEL